MSLSFTVVRGASDGTTAALAALRSAKQSVGLLEPIHVVVPTVGMREWLVEQVMRYDSESFGIVMNAKVYFLGDLHRGLTKPDDDPWSIDRQIHMLLPILDIATDNHTGADSFVSTSGGLLPAADRLAQLFNRYLSRRPRMMHQWEAGHRADASGIGLAPADSWQFDVWTSLRDAIGTEPALLSGVDGTTLPSHLLVFGIETLDERTLGTLQAMSTRTAISVVAIHPSPLLASLWDSQYPKSVSATTPPPARSTTDLPGALAGQKIALPYRWLRAAEEMQMAMARAGLSLQADFKDLPIPTSRLGRLQYTVAKGAIALRSVIAAEESRLGSEDDSVVLHRCHGLARQAEVCVDAIVKALNDSALRNPGENALQFHEIAVMSPNIKRIAPHLRAAFERKLKLSDNSTCKIPLRLADLNLGDTDDGARVFSSFLSLVGGRLDLDSVLDVLSDPAFVASRKLGPEALQRWELHLTRARQRWGIDAAHRKAGFGVEVTIKKQTDEQHTWLHSIRRILLGAAVQRDGADELLGHGVLSDVETDELEDVLQLIDLIETISLVVAERHTRKTARQWAVLLDQAFVRFCGPFSNLTSVPQRELRRLSSFSSEEGSPATQLTFDEVSRFITNQFEVVSDKRLTRSGEVVATGFGAQSHVPYRVICLVGVDDGAIPSGGRDGFDLSSRESLIGDPDPRHDVRRQLLTAVLSATDQVIITCDGRNLKNNEEKKLCAPLDEFISWCSDAGETIPEVSHPRHLYSPRNFVGAGVRGPHPWSHDEDARAVAEAMQSQDGLGLNHNESQIKESHNSDDEGSEGPTGPQIVMLQVKYLRDMLFAPLRVFLQWSYNIFKDWDPDDVDTTVLSLELTNRELSALAQRLVKGQLSALLSGDAAAISAASEQWKADNRSLHMLPVTDEAKKSTESIVEEVVGSAINVLRGFSNPSLTEFELRRLEIPNAGIVIEGEIPKDGTATVVVAEFDGRPPAVLKSKLGVQGNEYVTDLFMLRLLFYRACGLQVDAIRLIEMKQSFRELAKSVDDDASICASFEIRWREGNAPTTDEAVNWLAELVALHRRAAVTPVPTFVPDSSKSQTRTAAHLLYIANKPKEAEEAFVDAVNKYLESRQPQGSGDELLIYGAEPKFSECLPTVGPQGITPGIEQQFWLDRAAWWTRPEWKAGTKPVDFVAEMSLPNSLRPTVSSKGTDSV